MASQQELSFAIKAINEASKVLKDVQGDVAGLEGAAEKSGGKMAGFQKALGGVGTVAGGIVAAGALTKVGGYLSDAVQGAIEDEAATKRLEQALRNVGGAYDENLGKVNAAIDAGQKKAFTDDQVRDSFQSLLAATGDVNEALSRQQVAMDLSRGAGISLEQASRMVGKVNDENVEAFKRLGITIGEGATEAEALAAVQAKFAGQSDAYAKSTAGQFEQAKIRMGEVQEQIGAQLLPVVTKLGLLFLNDVVPAIEKFVNVAGPKIQEFAQNVRKYWESDIKPVIDELRDAWEKLAPVILPILSQIQLYVETTAKTIALALGIIIDLLGGDFSGAWEKAQELVRVQVDYIQGTIGNLVDFVQGIVPLMLEAAKAVGGAIIDGIKDGLSKLGNFATDVGGAILSALKTMVNTFVIDPINRALEFHIGGSIFGKDWGIDINPPDIPHLASGGVVRARPGGTLALLGEGGRDEAVIPLSRAGGAVGGTTVHIHGNVYGVDDLIYQMDRALKRAGQSGLVA